MTYRHPLAFLLGLEGVALLRAFAGDGFDREFTEERVAEVRALLPAGRHLPSDYLTAALSHGLEARGCAEPRWPPSDQAGGPLARTWCGAAADAAYGGTPAAIIGHFQRARG